MPTTTIILFRASFLSHGATLFLIINFFCYLQNKFVSSISVILLKSLVNLVCHGESELYDQPFIFDDSFHQSMSTLIF